MQNIQARILLGLLSNFIRFGNFGGKVAINIGALVFPEFYFFYRKMYKHGILFMLLFFSFKHSGNDNSGSDRCYEHDAS